MSLRQVVFVLAACTVPDKHELESNVHGDAGATVSHDAAGDATPDTTPPSVVAVNPSPGSAWRHGPIRLTFDEPLDAASVAATTAIATFSGDAIAVPIRASITFEAPGTVVIVLDKLPKNGGLLVVTVSATIADLAGNTIAQPLTFAVALE